MTSLGEPLLLKRNPSGSAGVRGIGAFGSVVLCFNTLLGPGLLQLPATYQRAGWLPATAALACVCLASGLAANFLCDVMARIPPGAKLPSGEPLPQRREFSDLFGYMFGRRLFLLTQLFFAACCFSQIISGIIAVAQVCDQAALFIIGTTGGVQLVPSPRLVYWTDADCAGVRLCVPFATASASGAPAPSLVLTLGYAVTTACLAPLGFLGLEENMPMQLGSFWVQCALLIKFGTVYVWRGLANFPLAAVGDGGVGEVFSDVLGVAIFNFALCLQRYSKGLLILAHSLLTRR